MVCCFIRKDKGQKYTCPIKLDAFASNVEPDLIYWKIMFFLSVVSIFGNLDQMCSILDYSLIIFALTLNIEKVLDRKKGANVTVM